ncbi:MULTISPECIES: arginase [Thermaerobacter]|uniref:Arginase n=1 Tax=Thermaerobacter composti TaxID=554949 RepID=A0ABZ0QPW4_9FIRM|nr:MULTISPECIES: arginase [Thermaerobacter]QBS36815.1 arginase [Thermaerobacter sp. FW80]WPD18797.1 arginase [Thermaerobacter composti]
MEPLEVGILGVPMDLGSSRRGTDMGPSAIRYARLTDALRQVGHRVRDLGNLEVPVAESLDAGNPRLKHIEAIEPVWRLLADRVARLAGEGRVPLVLGGDHSLAVGTIGGLLAAGWDDLGVLWFDAHADFNDPATTPSGNVHGMPVACIVGHGTPELLAHTRWLPRYLPARRLVMIGLRDVDPGEREKLRRSGIVTYTMQQIDELGIAEVTRRALQHLDGEGVRRLYVSFDVDVVDPDVAPGVGTPVVGGLTYRESHLAMEIVAESGLLAGMEVVEVNPIRDVLNRTAEVAVALIASAFGKRIL